MNYHKKYTGLINKAISFAVKTHEIDQKQKRKGKDVAYIEHPLTVGLILSLAGAHEDVIIAGILHDTIEDSEEQHKVTAELIEEHFGKNVAELVLSVTETDKNLSWEERKKEALEHITHFSHDSLLLKSADIISNVSEMVTDYDVEGDNLFTRFNAPKEKIIDNQLRAIAAIIQNWPDTPLAYDLISLAKRLQEIGSFELMQKYPAPVIEYKDYDENIYLECPVCGWRETSENRGSRNTDSHYCMDISCRICDKMILVADYPSA